MIEYITLAIGCWLLEILGIEILIENLFSVYYFFFVVSIQCVPTCFCAPYHCVPNLVEHSFAIVVPSSVDDTFGAVLISVACEVGDVDDIIVHIREATCPATCARSNPESVT